MAKFISLQVPGEQAPVYVNADQIRYLRPASGGRTTIHFESNHTLQVLQNPVYISQVGGTETGNG